MLPANSYATTHKLIKNLLNATKEPLTQQQIQAALEQQGVAYTERHVTLVLRDLVKTRWAKPVRRSATILEPRYKRAIRPQVKGGQGVQAPLRQPALAKKTAPAKPAVTALPGAILAYITQKPGITVQALIDRSSKLKAKPTSVRQTLWKMGAAGAINYGNNPPWSLADRPCFVGPGKAAATRQEGKRASTVEPPVFNDPVIEVVLTIFIEEAGKVLTISSLLENKKVSKLTKQPNAVTKAVKELISRGWVKSTENPQAGSRKAAYHWAAESPPPPKLRKALLTAIRREPGVTSLGLRKRVEDLGATPFQVGRAVNWLQRYSQIHFPRNTKGRQHRPCFIGPYNEELHAGKVYKREPSAALQQVLSYEMEPTTKFGKLLRAIQEEPGVRRSALVARAASFGMTESTVAVAIDYLKRTNLIHRPRRATISYEPQYYPGAEDDREDTSSSKKSGSKKATDTEFPEGLVFKMPAVKPVSHHRSTK